MPAQRLAMRQVYEVLRLKWGQGLSERKIAQSLGISRPAVAEYVRRAQAAGLSWPLPATCDAGALERLLFPSVPAILSCNARGARLGHSAPRTQAQGGHFVPAVAGI